MEKELEGADVATLLEKSAQDIKQNFDSRLEEQKKAASAKADELEARIAKFDAHCKDQGLQGDEIKKEFEKHKTDFETLQNSYKALQDHVDKLDAKAKVTSMHQAVEKSTQHRIAEKLASDDVIEQLKSMVSKKTSSFSVEVDLKGISQKAVADMGSANIGSGEMMTPPQPGVRYNPQRTWHMRDIIPVGQTSADTIAYYKEIGSEGGPAMQTEGALKAQVDFDVDLTRVSVETLAAFTVLSTQSFNDYAFLRSYIPNRLTEKMKIVEDTQILTGSGTTPNLHGVFTQAAAFAPSAQFATNVVDPNLVDLIIAGVDQATIAEYTPDNVLLYSADYHGILVLKGSDGHYLFPQTVFSAMMPYVAGVPMLKNTVTELSGNFLLGDFRKGAQLFDRESMNISFSYEDSDNFRRNKVTVRAEERLALAVYFPQAFVKGAIAAGITAITKATV